MPGPTLTPSQRAAIADDIRRTAGSSDGSVRRIADRHGVGMGTVRRVADEHGLAQAWRDGAYRTEAANSANAAHLAERRNQLQADILDDVEELRERLLADVVHLNVVKNAGIGEGESVEQTELPPGPRDLQAMMGAISAGVRTVVDLTRLEAENSGTGSAMGMIAQFTESLRQARADRNRAKAEQDGG